MTGILNLLAGAVGVVKDTYFNLVTLLLPGNGTNGAQNNTFLDSSSNNFTITRNGNTTQGTFSPFSQTGWSNFFDGTGDYLTSTVSSVGSSGDLTVEGWVYPTASGVRRTFFFIGSTGTFDLNLFTEITAGNVLRLLIRNDSVVDILDISSTTTVSTNTWSHVAFVLSGTSATIYLNGTSVATGTLSGTRTGTFTTGSIGALLSGGATHYFNGYISNLRYVKGTAVYTAAFTPPTAPLTAITNTSLLTCQSNRFIDNSSNAYTITRNGDTSVQAFSPFAPTAAYSASTNGGSGYSDGSGDYLTVASNANLTLGSSDFTIELWWYPTAFNSDGEIFTMGSNAGTNRCYAMYSSASNGTLSAYAGTGGTSWDIVSNLSMGTAIQNAWNHMAFTRSGSTFSTYLNGSRIATTTASGTLGSSGLGIFANNSGTSQAPSGYIGGARTIKGTALYTGTTYTVPTAPFTAVTNTNLLLNFTNAGITDATAKNDLETVGNAQISTTQSKFGGSSMYFDGTGDYITTAPRASNILGNGDFTVEFWAYPSNTSSAYRALVSSENYASTAGGWSIYQNGTSIEIWLTTSGKLIDATSALTSSTWQHIALSRASGTLRLFVNGTSVGSVSNSVEWTGQQIYVGDNNYSGIDYFYIGYIDDLRITKGYARYTANFSAPTAAFALQ